MAVEIIGLSELQKRLFAISGPGMLNGQMTFIGLAAVRNQKLLVHRKTGNTGRSIHLNQPVTNGVAVTEAGGAAAFLEFGTRPHIITPKAKKALRFAASPGGARLTGSPRIGAAVVFARVVHHPGTRPYPFMLPGAVTAVQETGLDYIIGRWDGL
jgi:hypothetical protein